MNESVARVRTWSPPDWRLVTVLAVAAWLSIRLFIYVNRYATELLFWDQWDVFESFFHGDPGIGELFFFQFGPHREGVGLLLDKFLFPLTHWSSRFESLELAASLVLTMLLALLLKRRLFGRITVTDMVIPVLVLPLSQFENLVGPLNPAHSVFPLLLVLIYCHVLLIRSPLPRYMVLLVVNFAMIYTGFAIFMGIVTIGVFLLACYRRLRGLEDMPLALPFVGLVIAGLSLGSYFINYTLLPFVGCYRFPWPQPLDYPRFMTGMFHAATRVSQSLRNAAGVTLFGATCVVGAMGAWRARHAQATDRVPLVIGVLALYSLLFSANAAVGRVCLGIGASQASRYSTLMIPAFLAIYLAVCTLSSTTLRSLLAVVLIAMFEPAHHLDPGMRAIGEAKRNWGECYIQYEDIDRCDASTNFRIHPEPERTRLKWKLDYLKEHHLNLYRERG